MLRFVVLGLLRNRNLPRHGYALMKEYEARAGVRLPTGNFYRQLSALVAEGLVEAVSPDAGRDARRAPYRITARGIEVFDAWFAAPLGAADVAPIDELGIRLLVLPEADRELARRVLERWNRDLLLRGKLIEQQRDRRDPAKLGPLDPHDVLLRRRLAHVSEDLEIVAAVDRAMAASAPHGLEEPEPLIAGRAREVRPRARRPAARP